MRDRQEVEHPRLSRLTLPTQHYEPLNLGGYRQNGCVYNFTIITLIKKLLFLFVLLHISIGMSVQTFEMDGIKYNVLTTSPDYTVEVMGYNAEIITGTVLKENRGTQTRWPEFINNEEILFYCHR
jgi:hypothetical protein